MGATVSSHRLSPTIMQDFADISNLTLGELQEEYNEWQHKHPSGFVDKKAFKKHMGRVLPQKSVDDIRYSVNKISVRLTLTSQYNK